MNKKLILICILIWMVILTGCSGTEAVFVSDESTEAAEAADEPVEEPVQIGVYICGAVNHPGIYYFSEGARIKDAVDAAGGINAEGAADSVNLAEYIHDCDRIYIPTKKEAEAVIVQAASNDGRVNINTATADELQTLPGIGASKAESIVGYREQNGPFTSVEELKNISGIKDGVFQKIKDLITV